ncbi:hypothetical protein Tco_1175908 [Tanacetum coccineum]
MPIPEVMLTNDLKASADYLEYLAKSTGHAQSKDKVYIPKIKRKQRVVEEIGQNDEVANEADLEATDEEEVEPLIRHRNIGIRIKVSDEPHLKGSNKEAGVTPKVPDGPGDDSNATDTTVIATNSVAKVTKNDNTVTLTSENVKMTDVEMVTDQHNPGESEVQSMVDVPVTKATPVALRHPPIESTVTLSPDTATIPSSLPPPTQPIQVKTKRFMKKSTFPNSQNNYSPLKNRVYRQERKIELPKRLPDFGKIKLENAAKKSMPTPSWSKADSKIYDQKDLLYIGYRKNVEDICHNSTPSAPVANKPNWFKESPRPETPNSPDLYSRKEPSATAGPEQTWFIDLEKNAKDPADVDDIFGPVYQLLKGTFRSCIELEYHLEQHYLTFSKQLDWINPEGNNTPNDFNNPLPLVSSPNRLYIKASHFFNKDLEYLRAENLEEKKYSASTT